MGGEKLESIPMFPTNRSLLYSLIHQGAVRAGVRIPFASVEFESFGDGNWKIVGQGAVYFSSSQILAVSGFKYDLAKNVWLQ